MAQESVVIPEKIYFKIGEVCDLLDVQAHVLRYWETEFPMLSPQKNKSGQRSYRRRDVEIAVRIKQLLYNEMFTIAGAKKKLQLEIREGNKPKLELAETSEFIPSEETKVVSRTRSDVPTLFDDFPDLPVLAARPAAHNQEQVAMNGDQREAFKILASNLLEIREILKPKTSRV
ncbi:MAG: MerR family transcriptional regulator [Pyrinomonadaceae bacterium]|nr:MerR family transcriptional regulator [Pyrinomonadaceae bacterium]MBP6213599.1 MerR family transcriptional regulator [Pyrinomonadaceae bacterium]